MQRGHSMPTDVQVRPVPSACHPVLAAVQGVVETAPARPACAPPTLPVAPASGMHPAPLLLWRPAQRNARVTNGVIRSPLTPTVPPDFFAHEHCISKGFGFLPYTRLDHPMRRRNPFSNLHSRSQTVLFFCSRTMRVPEGPWSLSTEVGEDRGRRWHPSAGFCYPPSAHRRNIHAKHSIGPDRARGIRTLGRDLVPWWAEYGGDNAGWLDKF